MKKSVLLHPFGLEYVIVIATLILLTCINHVRSSQKTVCVNVTDNKNMSKADSEVNCHSFLGSLESAIDELQDKTTIAIFNKQINVAKKVLVHHKNSINLKGEVKTKIICNTVNAGFAFDNVSNLQISNIEFVECSLNFINHTVSERNLVIIAAVFIVNSTNVTISNVIVSRSLGIGMFFSQTRGNVEVYDSIFEYNGCSVNHTSYEVRGGGLYIEVKHSVHSTAQYVLCNCEFNQNNSTDPAEYESDDNKYWGAKNYEFTQGGGITLFFEENQVDSDIIIEKCTIFQNQADWGGGMIIIFLNDFSNHSEESRLIVQNSMIIDNIGQRHGGGVSIYFSEGMQCEKPIVEFSNCTIEQNSAKIYGGGVRTVTTKSSRIVDRQLIPDTTNQSKSIIVFTNCVWTKNSALFGSAVDIFPQDLDHKYPWTIQFSDCTIMSNTIRLESKSNNASAIYQYHYNGKGALSCTLFTLIFSGKTSVENNSGSAMHLSSCHMKFETDSDAYFVNNTGYNGGAIVLIGQSMLEAGASNTFCFINNTASWRGGAIMYFSNSEQDFISLNHCFIEFKYHDNSSEDFPQFYFKNNKAQFGDAIFAITLEQCARYCASKDNNNITVSTTKNVSNYSELHCIGSFNFSDSEHKPVATSGNSVYSKSKSDQTLLQAQPGREVTLDFEFMDSHLQPSYDVFHVSVQNTKLDGNVTINPSYSYIAERKKLKFSGKPGDTAIVSLVSTEFQLITASIEFQVQLTSCQPGFVITTDLECACSATQSGNMHYAGIRRCNSKRGKAYIVHGYWAGYIDSVSEDTLATGHCPRGFCNYNNSQDSRLKIEYELPNTTVTSISDLSTFICGSNRTGILCGRCEGNFSLYFHGGSYDCKPNNQRCHYGLLLFVLSELLPVTVIFIGVIFCNVQFTSGAVNSLIFFAQVIDMMRIDANGLIKKHPVITAFQGVYLLFYRMFNLDFFSLENLSYCLMENATALDVLAFKYVTITYSLLFVLICITILKFCNPYLCLKKCFISSKSYERYVKQSAIHGLIAIVVMCYSQCTSVSLSILTPGYVYGRGFGENRTITKVVYLNGDLNYFRRDHLKYAIPAVIFTIIFTIIPPVCLIVYPLCYKIFALCHIEETLVTRILCLVVPLEKIRPVFDSVQGCFKDKYRFFGGLYFLYRFIILVYFTASKRPIEFFTLLEVQLIVTVALHAITQPYNKQWHNILDVSLLSLLAAINAMTIHNYHTLLSIEEEMNTKSINIVSTLQTALAYIPLLCLFAFCAAKIVLKTRKHCTKQKDYSRENYLVDTLALVDYRDLNTEYTESSQDSHTH